MERPIVNHYKLVCTSCAMPVQYGTGTSRQSAQYIRHAVLRIISGNKWNRGYFHRPATRKFCWSAPNKPAKRCKYDITPDAITSLESVVCMSGRKTAIASALVALYIRRHFSLSTVLFRQLWHGPRVLNTQESVCRSETFFAGSGQSPDLAPLSRGGWSSMHYLCNS